MASISTKLFSRFKDFFKERSKYVILFASSLSFMCCTGFSYGVIGPLTLAQSRHFNESLTESSWTGSIHIGIFLIMGPLAALLTKILSDRLVQMLGGLLAAVGITLSTLAKTGWEVTALFGFLTGASLSLVRCASSDVLVYHFDEDTINYALSAVMIGYAVGLAVFPTIAESVFEKFSFGGGMAVMALFMKVHIISGIIYSRPDNEASETPSRRTTIAERFSSLVTNLKLVFRDSKVWSFVLSGFFRKFGVTAFFSISDAYTVAQLALLPSQAAVGNTVLGASSATAVVIGCALQRFKYNRLLAHSIISICFGITVILVVFAQNHAVYLVIMAACGLSYGAQIANLLGAAYELSNKESMVFVMGVELMLEGFGSVAGPPLTSYIQVNLGLIGGICLAGASCIFAGLIILVVYIRAKIIERKEQRFNNELERLVVVSRERPVHLRYKAVRVQTDVVDDSEDDSSNEECLQMSDTSGH